jgi:protein-S-isoprenylcysteine O-methyltransferase Ste14
MTRAEPVRDHAGVRFPPPLIYALPFIAGVLLHRYVGHDRLPRGAGISRLVGWVLLVGGLVLDLSAVGFFRRFRTSLIPIRPSTTLVTSGPYRFTRNPMYLGMGLVYLGLPLLLGYAWPYAFFPLAVILMDRLAIRHEESYLDRKFGEPYRRYRESVRRWI